MRVGLKSAAAATLNCWVTNLVQWTSNGASRACDYLRVWCVHPEMMVSTEAGSGGRGAARRTNAGNTRGSCGGCSTKKRRPRSSAKVQHAETARRAAGGGTAPMSGATAQRQGGQACTLIGVDSDPQRQLRRRFVGWMDGAATNLARLSSGRPSICTSSRLTHRPPNKCKRQRNEHMARRQPPSDGMPSAERKPARASKHTDHRSTTAHRPPHYCHRRRVSAAVGVRARRVGLDMAVGTAP
jgi:hypothetical protein